MIADKLWQVISGVLGLLLLASLAVAGYLYVDRAHVEVQLAEQKGSYDTLKGAVTVANASLQTLSAQGEAAGKRFDTAIAVASRKDALFEPLRKYVQSAKGVTCTDAMPLLNAALKGALP